MRKDMAEYITPGFDANRLSKDEKQVMHHYKTASKSNADIRKVGECPDVIEALSSQQIKVLNADIKAKDVGKKRPKGRN